jgi:hypothetical protein
VPTSPRIASSEIASVPDFPCPVPPCPGCMSFAVTSRWTGAHGRLESPPALPAIDRPPTVCGGFARLGPDWDGLKPTVAVGRGPGTAVSPCSAASPGRMPLSHELLDSIRAGGAAACPLWSCGLEPPPEKPLFLRRETMFPGVCTCRAWSMTGGRLSDMDLTPSRCLGLPASDQELLVPDPLAPCLVPTQQLQVRLLQAWSSTALGPPEPRQPARLQGQLAPGLVPSYPLKVCPALVPPELWSTARLQAQLAPGLVTSYPLKVCPALVPPEPWPTARLQAQLALGPVPTPPRQGRPLQSRSTPVLGPPEPWPPDRLQAKLALGPVPTPPRHGRPLQSRSTPALGPPEPWTQTRLQGQLALGPVPTPPPQVRQIQAQSTPPLGPPWPWTQTRLPPRRPLASCRPIRSRHVRPLPSDRRGRCRGRRLASRVSLTRT